MRDHRGHQPLIAQQVEQQEVSVRDHRVRRLASSPDAACCERG
jgi:hypothetical protein